MGKYSLETHYEVWDDTHGVGLRVGPEGELGGIVEVRTNGGPKSEEFFGKVHLSITVTMAKLLGEALIKAAKDMEEADGAKSSDPR